MTREREMAHGILMYITKASNPCSNGQVCRGKKARAKRTEGDEGRAGPRRVAGVSSGKGWFLRESQAEGGHGTGGRI